jgi:lipopolysaccharide export LptBFGC system permease protein LptF
MPRFVLTLERTILLELTVNLALILCVMTGVFFIGSLIRFLSDARELGLSVVITILPYLLPELTRWTIPSSLLLASIMTFGRMAEDNEITALRAGGVPIYHVVLPALFLGMVLSGISLFLNAAVIPAASLKQRDAIQNVLGRFRSKLEGARENSYVFKTRRLSWQRIDEEGALVGLTIDRRAGRTEERDILCAARARIGTDATEEHLVFELEDLTIQRWDEAGKPLPSGHSVLYPLVIRVEDLLGAPSSPRPKELDLWRLIYAVDRKGQHRYSYLDLQQELHERLALALAPFVLVLVGASFGIIARKGSLVTSFLLAFVGAAVPYYGMLLAGRALFKEGIVPAAAGMWPPNLVMGVIGLVLLRKAVRG